jgi:hypothetical protein
MFKVTLPTNVIITLMLVAIPFAVFSELIFSRLIIRPCPHLGSFGAVHDSICAWILRAWEGLRVCWDVTTWAVLRVGKDVAGVFGARHLGAELVIIESEGNQRGGDSPLALMGISESGEQESHPPPYNVGMHYMKRTVVLIVTLA